MSLNQDAADDVWRCGRGHDVLVAPVPPYDMPTCPWCEVERLRDAIEKHYRDCPLDVDYKGDLREALRGYGSDVTLIHTQDHSEESM